MIFLQFYINESQNDELTKKYCYQLFKKICRKKNIMKSLRVLIKQINCNEDLKVYCLIHIFAYSQGGWLENFVNKEALKDAVLINQINALNYLAEVLEKKFQHIYYYVESTANLIRAFEYVELQSDEILAMYKEHLSL